MTARGLPRRPTVGEWWTYAIVTLALTAVAFLSLRGTFLPDIKPEVYLNPWARLRLDLSTWLPDPYLGTQNYNLGLAPVDALVGIMQSLGVPAELSVRVLRLILMLVAGAGAYFLFGRLSPATRSPAARASFVLLFVINPYTIVAGSTLAILLPYALFPWFVAALLVSVTTRGWRAPALAALALAGMSGMNVGAVPALQLAVVPALVLWALWQKWTDWGVALRGLGKIALLSLPLALYWLVPAISAMGTAQAVIGNSETLEAIAGPSGWGEVLRGLGLWPMYGGSAAGPWEPGFQVYLSSPLVVISSFMMLVLAVVGAAMSKSRARVLGVALLATVGTLMVGLHPYDNSSPVGSIMNWFFVHIPGLMVVRTTNKAGAALLLGLALLVALAVERLALARITFGIRSTVSVALVVVWILACLPLWSGQAAVGRWSIPDYWYQASAALNTPGAGRLWLIPGQVLAGYQWSTDSVDEVTASLFDQRSTVVRTVLPTQNRESSNLLYNADNQLQSITLPVNGLSSYARDMGVSQILVRTDVRWVESGGLDPSLVYLSAKNDTGLRLSATFGPSDGSQANPAGGHPLAVPNTPTLAVFDVINALPAVRVKPVDGTVVIAGDAAGIRQADTAGLLAGNQATVYAANLSPAQLAAFSGARHRWVLTDSNRRTNVAGATLQGGTSALLSALDPAPETRAIGQPWDQTTAAYANIAGVTASSYAFDSHGIAGNPSFALDDNRLTSWLTGAFGTAVGQWIDVDFGKPRTFGNVFIIPAEGIDRSITSFKVTFGGVTRTILVRPDGSAGTDLSGLIGDNLRIEIASTKGTGNGYVGIRDIVWGTPAGPAGARLPQSFDLLAGRARLTQAQLASTPLDITMSRSTRQDWSLGSSEEQPSLYRTFTLPVAKTYRAYGSGKAVTGFGKGLSLDSDGCLLAGTLDGQPFKVRVLDVAALRAEHSWLYTGCSEPTLSSGKHEVGPTLGVVLDTLVLRDTLGESPIVGQGLPPTSTILEQSPTSLQVKITNPSAIPLWLSAGTATDPGWRASINGVDLGTPTPVDGYSMSWPIPASTSVIVDVTFRPQKWANLSRWASVLALLVVIALAIAGRTRRRPLSLAAPWRPTTRTVAAAAFVWCVATGGLVGLAIGAVAAAVIITGGLSRRGWFVTSVVVACAAPVAWIIGNNELWGSTTGQLVTGNPLPGWLAWASVTAAAIGIAFPHRTPVPRELLHEPTDPHLD